MVTKKISGLLLGGLYSLATTIIITGAMSGFSTWLYRLLDVYKTNYSGFFIFKSAVYQSFLLTIFLNFDFYFVQLSLFSGVKYFSASKCS